MNSGGLSECCPYRACSLVELASKLWQAVLVSKIPSSRNVIGIITALLWVAVGVYMTLRGVNSTWKLVGYGVIAVGVLRGFMLLQHWDRNQQMTAPLRGAEHPLAYDDDDDDEGDGHIDGGDETDERQNKG